MNIKKLTLVSTRIILVFAVGIAMSLLADHISGFLGDWKCQGIVRGKFIPSSEYDYAHFKNLGCTYGPEGRHSATVHWGYRHWLFFAMGLCLFFLQTVDIINYISKKDAK